MSPEELRKRRAAQKREAAARFISCSLIGAYVPHDSDEVFRSALADGVLLCHLLNSLRSGTILNIVENNDSRQLGSVRQTFENVTNFLDAAIAFTTETFAAADLEPYGDMWEIIAFAAIVASTV